MRRFLTLVCALAFIAAARTPATATVVVVDNQVVATEATPEAAIDAANEASEEKFAGFGFAPALIGSFDIGSHERVDTAEIVGDPKVVRVTKDNNVNVGFGLESHYMFLPPARFLGIPQLMEGKWGVGPYVSVTLGSNDIIDTVGAGFVLGLRRDAFFDVATDAARTNGDSFNIGVGIAIDPDAKVLGAGFNSNQPPPAGEDQVRFRTTSQVGCQVFFSYQFNVL
ncbi:MAG: hypothetical protein AAB417_01640 [Patescibacteria group bacterium]